MILGLVSGILLMVILLAIFITNVIAWPKANINDSFIKVWLLTYNLIQVVAFIGGIAQFILQ